MRHGRLLPALPVISETESADTRITTGKASKSTFEPTRRSTAEAPLGAYDRKTHGQANRSVPAERVERYRLPSNETRGSYGHPVTAVSHSTLRAALALPFGSRHHQPKQIRSFSSERPTTDKPLPPPPQPYPRRRAIPAPLDRPEQADYLVRTLSSCPRLIVSDYDLDLQHASQSDGESDIDTASSTPLQTPVLDETDQLPHAVRIVDARQYPYRPSEALYRQVKRANGNHHTPKDSTDSDGSDKSNDSDDIAIIRYVKDPKALRVRLAQAATCADPRWQSGSARNASFAETRVGSVPNGIKALPQGPIERPSSVILRPKAFWRNQPTSALRSCLHHPASRPIRRSALIGSFSDLQHPSPSPSHAYTALGLAGLGVREVIRALVKAKGTRRDICKMRRGAVALWYAVLAVLVTGQVGAMTLRQRQEAGVTEVPGPGAGDTGVEATATSLASMTSATSAVLESGSQVTSASTASPSTLTTSLSNKPVTTVTLSASESAPLASSDSSGSSTSQSASGSSASSSPEKLQNPSNPPAPAPGGMAFILPAFVIIGCVFIVWLIHNLRVYQYKIKEVEAEEDTQSPDPSKGAASGPEARGARMTKHGERKWRKRGWKELGSGDDYTDDERDEKYERYGRGHEGREGHDRGQMRHGRDYAYEYGYKDRDEGRRERKHRTRDAVEEGAGGDKYSRVEDWQGSRKYRTRDRTRTKSTARGETTDGGREKRDGVRGGSHSADVPKDGRLERRRSTQPGKSSSTAPHGHNRDGIMQNNVDIDTGNANTGVRHRHDHAHDYDRRELEKYRRAPDAYEDEFDERYLDLFAVPGTAAGGQTGQLQVQLGPHDYRTASRDGTPILPPASRNVDSRNVNPKLTVEAPTPVDSRFPRPNTPISNPHCATHMLGQADETPKRRHTARHAPLNLRARATSPPPVLSPPMNPTLFFHTGPSVTNLNAAAIGAISTDGSCTDMSSVGVGPEEGARDEVAEAKGESMMPSIPSTAEKLGSFDATAQDTPKRVERPLETPRGKTIRRVGVDSPRRANTGRNHGDGSLSRTPTGRSARKAVPSSTAALEKRASRRGTAPAESPSASPAKGSLSAATLRRAAMRELQERAKAQAAMRGDEAEGAGSGRSDSTGPKSRVQKKEEKARGKVQEILRESWSERAVVGSMVPISGLADTGTDEESEEDSGNKGEKHRDEVAMHRQQRAHVDAEEERSQVTLPAHAQASTRPLSPRNIPLPAGTGGMASPGREDVGRLQGIEQRFAAIQRTEEL